jgi:hypothetical protein
MESVEVLPPVAPSPLDSMRGRGKRGGFTHQKYTNSEKHPKGNKTIVILVLPENTSKPIVGHKQ